MFPARVTSLKSVGVPEDREPKQRKRLAGVDVGINSGYIKPEVFIYILFIENIDGNVK